MESNSFKYFLNRYYYLTFEIVFGIKATTLNLGGIETPIGFDGSQDYLSDVITH